MGPDLHVQVTEYYHQLGEYEEQPPAVFFLYDMSPIKMVRKEVFVHS